MLRTVSRRRQSLVQRGLQTISHVVLRLTKPSRHSLALPTLADLARSKPQLVAENLLLRH